MNKEQAYTDAVAADRHVCNQHSFDAGWDAAIAELAKVSEPIGESNIPFGAMLYDELPIGTKLFTLPQPDLVAEIERLSEKCRDSLAQNETDAGIIKSDGKEIHFLRQQLSASKAEISQRITVDEMNAEIDSASKAVAEHYEKQLSAAQADSEQLVKALKKCTKAYSSSHVGQLVDEAIAAHKARQQGKEQP